MNSKLLGTARFYALLCAGGMLFGSKAFSTEVSSPVIVATSAELTQGTLANSQPDAPLSSYSVAGTRYWLGSQWNYSGKIIQSLMQGDAEHPFGSVLWTKSTCNLDPATTYCVNGPNAAFTKLNPVDVRSLWFVGLYQPQPNDGGLLAIIHEENAGAAHRNRIGLAWSSDNGNTWNYLGRIISPYGDPDGVNIQGAPYLIKDGFLYVYYTDVGDETLPPGSNGLSVARANLNDVLSAARSGGIGTNLWHKYYGGSFSEPGLGGRATLLGPYGITHTQAVHSQYTGKYYVLLSVMAWGGANSFVKLYESTDAISWTPSATLADEAAASLRPNGGYQYCSIVDPGGVANGEANDIFNVYCAKDPLSSDSPHVALYRWRVNLSDRPEYYRQSVNYSSQQGPRWWYQTGRNSTIYDMSFENGFWQGTDRWSAIYTDSMHPAENEIPVLKWVAPRAGTVRIEGTVRDADVGCGNGVSTSIVHNGSSIFAADIDNGDTVGKSIDVVRQVAAGDGVFFMVAARGTDYYCDSTRWDPSIEYQ
ncbi:hypothetical protein [Luteibacter sp. UNCMF366Tsu5.1]|uniref:hypothetical protein n=1 Tax=Luteibacter sp. UNCMF366Tsu5.1 TaxID=1502758 RepID=UPI0009091D9F|nr:hypothetical protein [Luteibacter sp. UNCMF366Tsu5.1]SFW44680.1 hypothetical protein SAMN02800691_1870 [Luteibacter sp. UNCMF366Tsu5.1]